MYKWLFHIGLALCLGLPFLTTVAQAEGEDDPLWNKPSYEKKIIQIGQRILKANHIQEQIEFHYIPKDVRNAAAAHSGQPNTVYVWKDMLDVISSDDELAAILSHEIAHIMKRHQGKALARKIPVRIGGALLAGTLAGVTIYTTGGLATPLVAPLVKTGVRAVEAPMQRSLEREADLVGLDYLVNAGYNPLAMETIFRNGGNGDAGPFTRMFLDHPVGTKRLAYIHEAIQQKYPQFLQDSSPQQKPADIPADASVHVVEQLTAEQSATTVKEEKATVVLETAASEQGEPVTPVSGETKDLLRNTPEVAQKNIPVETTEKAVPIDRDSKVGITQTVAESRSQPTNPEEAMRTVTKAPAVNQKVNPKKENVPASQAAIAALSVQERVNHQRNTVSSKMAEEPSPVKVIPIHPAAKGKAKHISKQQAAQPQKAVQPPPVQMAATLTPQQEKWSAPALENPPQKANVALTLLELDRDQQKALKLVAARHYMSWEDLQDYYPGWEPALVNRLLQALVDKKLLRLVGGDPSDHGYVLTDAASEILEK